MASFIQQASIRWTVKPFPPTTFSFSTSSNTHLQFTFLLSNAPNRYLWPQPVGALVPMGGSQPNLRPSSVTKSCAAPVPAQEQLGKQMPSFSDLVKNWHCHVSKHTLFSFYRNSRKAFICTRVHLRQQCCTHSSFHSLPGLGGLHSESCNFETYREGCLGWRDGECWLLLQRSSSSVPSTLREAHNCLSPSSGLSGHQACMQYTYMEAKESHT